jgi:hypothetical protein
MSHQKKKKTSPQQLKQQEAESRKKFFLKIKWLFSICGHEELFKLLPVDHLKTLYKLQYHSPTIRSVGNLPSGIKNDKQLIEDIHSLMKYYSINIPNTENRISFYDYFTVGMVFNMGIVNLESSTFANKEIIQETMKEFRHSLFSTEPLHNKICHLVNSCHFHYSSINKGFYSIHYLKDSTPPTESTSTPTFRLRLELQEQYQPRPIEIKIDNSVRPVFEVGWLIKNCFTPCRLTASDLYLDPEVYKAPIPVYIQSHAINRLSERIHLIDKGITHFQLYASLIQNPQVIQMGDKSYMIGYRFEEWKIGYVVADLIGKRLIIRTFLLATQAGTPEEQKFRKITNLNRNDIDYLKMTILGKFAESGIEDNPRLKSIFDEAGLTPLLECASFLYSRKAGVNPFSDKLLKYLTIEQLNPNWHELAETIKDDAEEENQHSETDQDNELAIKQLQL